VAALKGKRLISDIRVWLVSFRQFVAWKRAFWRFSNAANCVNPALPAHEAQRFVFPVRENNRLKVGQGGKIVSAFALLLRPHLFSSVELPQIGDAVVC
jgi:hypothetical protein